MPRPAIYSGSMTALVSEWEARYKTVWHESGWDGLRDLKIADGQCARLPQQLTTVGHTSRCQPGERVVDVARTLKPGTVIANFLFEHGKAWYPNSNGWHAALFVRGEAYSTETGKATRIVMFDQWKGKWPSVRTVRSWSPHLEKNKDPSNVAGEFFVVMIP